MEFASETWWTVVLETPGRERVLSPHTLQLQWSGQNPRHSTAGWSNWFAMSVIEKPFH